MTWIKRNRIVCQIAKSIWREFTSSDRFISPRTCSDERLDVRVGTVYRHLTIGMTQSPKADLTLNVRDIIRRPTIVTQRTVGVNHHFIAADTHVLYPHRRAPYTGETGVRKKRITQFRHTDLGLAK